MLIFLYAKHADPLLRYLIRATEHARPLTDNENAALSELISQIEGEKKSATYQMWLREQKATATVVKPKRKRTKRKRK